jgi:hypothetical protein
MTLSVQAPKLQKVLVVDDEPDIRRVGQMSLELVGQLEVVLASGGEEALSLAAQERPDVILLDVMMPRLDGPATLDRLRQAPETADNPGHLHDRQGAEARGRGLPRPRGQGCHLQAIRPDDPLPGDWPHRLQPVARTAHEDGPAAPDEQARLAAVRATGLLDTGPEEAFDEIVRLATLVFRTPCGYLSLVDADRVFYKARVNVPLRQKPREGSLSAWCLLEGQAQVVPDTFADERFRSSPVVRLAAGALLGRGALVTPQGHLWARCA